MPHAMSRSPDDTHTSAAELASSIAYHKTLIDQQRQLRPENPKISLAADNGQTCCAPTPRSWLPFVSRLAGGDARGSGHGAAGASIPSDQDDDDVGSTASKTRIFLGESERATSAVSLGARSEPTRKDIEEYQALPLAIQRKFFSSSERLRLAQSARKLPDDERDTTGWAAAFNSYTSRDPPLVRPVTSPLPARPPFQDQSDFLVLANLPAKVREKHLTRQEQLLLAKQLRQAKQLKHNVLLDAADEALYRIGRKRAKHQHNLELVSPTSHPRPIAPPTTQMPSKTLISAEEAALDSFRWFDEDDDLDLDLDARFAIKNAPAQPTTVQSGSRREGHPFRRGLSFSRMSFSRASISSMRPQTGEATQFFDALPENQSSNTQHGRRKSRAFSIMGPRQITRRDTRDSVLSVDPAAAHYQDPDARAKLRAYLASPQKFDEAVEFGFVSFDGANMIPRRPSLRLSPHDTEDSVMRTFLSDDLSSTYSEDLSMPDPESPQTPPQVLDKDCLEALQLPFEFDENQFKLTNGYVHAQPHQPHQREMTLRMTLTRPDLRAEEYQMYGWQQVPRLQPTLKHSRAMTQSRFELGQLANPSREMQQKESIDRIFAEIDQELGPSLTDEGTMKRLWKKVVRN